MKIALTKKIITKKEKKASFMTPLSEGNGNRKKPQGRPPPPFSPPPLPSCESPTTCKDEIYRGSRRPSYRIRRQMARKKRTSQQIIFNKIREKGKAGRG